MSNHNTYEIHRYYSSRPGAGDEFGAELDRELEGAWKRCDEKGCNNYHHPDSDYCAKHALGDANYCLSLLLRDKSTDQGEVDDATRWVKYCESIVLYEAAPKEQEAEAWYAMMLRRDQAMNPQAFVNQEAA